MTDVKKSNQITPTENKHGAEDMNRKVSFKRKKSKIDKLGQSGRSNEDGLQEQKAS